MTTDMTPSVRALSAFFLLLIPALVALGSCSNDDGAGPGNPVDSIGIVRFIIDGVTRVARVDSLSITGGRMAAHGHWNEQVVVAGAPSTLLLECLLTSPARVGSHPVDSTSDSTSFFTLIGAVVGNCAGSRSYRARQMGGAGSVTLAELSDTLVSGTIQMTLLNDNDRNDSNLVSGEFSIRRE